MTSSHIRTRPSAIGLRERVGYTAAFRIHSGQEPEIAARRSAWRARISRRRDATDGVAQLCLRETRRSAHSQFNVPRAAVVVVHLQNRRRCHL
jgi:hypothetical protein